MTDYHLSSINLHVKCAKENDSNVFRNGGIYCYSMLCLNGSGSHCTWYAGHHVTTFHSHTSELMWQCLIHLWNISWSAKLEKYSLSRKSNKHEYLICCNKHVDIAVHFKVDDGFHLVISSLFTYSDTIYTDVICSEQSTTLWKYIKILGRCVIPVFHDRNKNIIYIYVMKNKNKVHLYIHIYTHIWWTKSTKIWHVI